MSVGYLDNFRVTKSVPIILEHLLTIERDSVVISARNGTPQQFLRVSDWLVAPRQCLASLSAFLRNVNVVPVFRRSHLIRFAACIARGDTVLVPTASEMINVRSHWQRTGFLRCFYRGKRRVSAKCSIGSADGAKLIAREWENRQVVSSIGMIAMPKVFEYREGELYCTIEEEWVDGIIPAQRHWLRKAVAEQLLPSLAAHYHAYGITLRPVSEVFGTGLGDEVAETIEQSGWNSHWGNQKSFLGIIRDIEGRNRLLPTSLCHCDLNIGHLVLTPGNGIVVLDWDAVREAPVAVDCIDLLQQKVAREELWFPALRHLQGLSGERQDSCSPNEQLLLAAVRRLVRWKEFKNRFSSEGRSPLHLVEFLRREISYAVGITRGVAS